MVEDFCPDKFYAILFNRSISVIVFSFILLATYFLINDFFLLFSDKL